MFSQRRKKYKNMIWAGVLVAVAILAFVVLLGYLSSFKDRDYEEPVRSREIVSAPEETLDRKSEPNYTIEEHDEKKNTAEDEKKETYYLLKYDNDVIRVFFSDQEGQLTELEETNIVYETLSMEDQRRFEEGIQVENRDVLNRLLMDYES